MASSFFCTDESSSLEAGVLSLGDPDLDDGLCLRTCGITLADEAAAGFGTAGERADV